MGEVLIVDDYPDAGETCAWLLQSAGHTARVAASGQEALLALAELRPAVLLVDLGVRGATDNFITALRQRRELAGLAIVLMSGAFSVAAWAHSLGLQSYLLKPYAYDDLLDVVNHALAPRSPTDRVSLGTAVAYGRVRPPRGRSVRGYLRTSSRFQIPAHAQHVRTILVLDDQADLRDVYQEVLQAEGHRVVLAASAREAMQALQAEGARSALVMLELSLVVGADELVETIRGRTADSTLACVLISGAPLAELKQRAAALGANAYLRKPVTVERLVETIRRVSERC
jgi:DNA-binding NtrC family response regulator